MQSYEVPVNKVIEFLSQYKDKNYLIETDDYDIEVYKLNKYKDEKLFNRIVKREFQKTIKREFGVKILFKEIDLWLDDVLDLKALIEKRMLKN